MPRRSQNPQYRIREQLFFLGTVGNDCPLKRDLRNPTNTSEDAALRSAVFTSLTRVAQSKSSRHEIAVTPNSRPMPSKVTRIAYVFAVEEVGLEEPFCD